MPARRYDPDLHDLGVLPHYAIRPDLLETPPYNIRPRHPFGGVDAQSEAGRRGQPVKIVLDGPSVAPLKEFLSLCGDEVFMMLERTTTSAFAPLYPSHLTREAELSAPRLLVVVSAVPVPVSLSS